MDAIEYIGLDVHKKTISYSVKAADGRRIEGGKIPATRQALDQWIARRKAPWKAAMEATLFTGWIYDHLKPHAAELQVGHPAMLKAITAAKKKNDGLDADRLADLLRCNLVPVCYMAPTEIRDLRRVLRYRNLIVREAVRMKNRTAGLLMEVGAQYNKRRLHGKKYFSELLKTLEVPDSLLDLLRLSRGAVEMFQAMQRRLVAGLQQHPLLAERVERLKTVDGVGDIVALTWALEIGEVARFPSIGQAESYCGLTSAQRNSAGKEQRGPISKQRNRHLQWVLVEAAKAAPRRYPHLRRIYERECERGHRNRATLVVARKLVAYLMAVDRSGQPFRSPELEVGSEANVAAEASQPDVGGKGAPLRPLESSLGLSAPAVKALR